MTTACLWGVEPGMLMNPYELQIKSTFHFQVAEEVLSVSGILLVGKLSTRIWSKLCVVNIGKGASKT
jgi:hypothetical protein